MPTDFQSLFAEGYRARSAGDAAHSRATFIDATRKAAEERNEPALAEAMCGLAQAERDIGNCEAALHHYSNATLLYRRIGPPERLAYVLRHQADLTRTTPHPADAEPLFHEAEAIYRNLGQPHTLDLANTLRGLALTSEVTGNPDAAIPLWQQARVLYAKLGIQAGVEECDKRLAPAAG
jgi:tetratricopeptide (TPR) repeat protein